MVPTPLQKRDYCSTSWCELTTMARYGARRCTAKPTPLPERPTWRRARSPLPNPAAYQQRPDGVTLRGELPDGVGYVPWRCNDNRRPHSGTSSCEDVLYTTH